MRDPGTIATTCTGIISMILPIIILILCIYTHGFNIATFVVIMVIELIFVLVLLFWVPLYVDVVNDNVIVRYIARTAKICSVDEIIRVKYIESVSPMYLFCAGIGNRGFFGVAAECMEIKGIGHCYFYSRRSRDLTLLILRDGRKYLVAPRDVNAFIEKLRSKNPYIIYDIQVVEVS